MALEIERKYRVADFSELRERLKAFGATCDGAFLETNILLDTPDHRLRDSGCGLRIRKWQQVEPAGQGVAFAELTFKGPLQSATARIREELEVSVGDPRLAAEMLQRLGYLPIMKYIKRRERWRCAGAHVELDTLPILGLFVEVEAESVDRVSDVSRKLELPESMEEPRTYVAMLFELCSRKGIDPLQLASQSRSALGVV